jgi:hypothetical protein
VSEIENHALESKQYRHRIHEESRSKSHCSSTSGKIVIHDDTTDFEARKKNLLEEGMSPWEDGNNVLTQVKAMVSNQSNNKLDDTWGFERFQYLGIPFH